MFCFTNKKKSFLSLKLICQIFQKYKRNISSYEKFVLFHYAKHFLRKHPYSFTWAIVRAFGVRSNHPDCQNQTVASLPSVRRLPVPPPPPPHPLKPATPVCFPFPVYTVSIQVHTSVLPSLMNIEHCMSGIDLFFRGRCLKILQDFFRNVTYSQKSGKFPYQQNTASKKLFPLYEPR